MKKIFTLFAAALCSMMSFAQDISFVTESGEAIANGSTVTIEGRYEFMLYSGICVTNNSDSPQVVYAKVKAVSGDAQFCYGGSCTTVDLNPETTNIPEVSDAKSSIVEAGDTVDLAIEAIDMMASVITRTVEVSAWTNANPDEVITATVTFTNDPEVLNAASISNTSVTANKVYAYDNVLYCNFVDANARQLQVFDVAGQMKKNVRLNSESTSYSLEGMAKGIYLYRVVEGGKNVLSGKFLVK